MVPDYSTPTTSDVWSEIAQFAITSDAHEADGPTRPTGFSATVKRPRGSRVEMTPSALHDQNTASLFGMART